MEIQGIHVERSMTENMQQPEAERPPRGLRLLNRSIPVCRAVSIASHTHLSSTQREGEQPVLAGRKARMVVEQGEALDARTLEWPWTCRDEAIGNPRKLVVAIAGQTGREVHFFWGNMKHRMFSGPGPNLPTWKSKTSAV
ncbi:hypothetical protein GGP41_008227 [Bipolaris sorokiniana]|uniref:Uncharacterized protein n=1 Tax=Cochliobolus sativus TaxID=45130 RepID=A0A8H5ZPJ7_COCSA|nr:hypothetical protein GGP41_008227 [Bipolaris sorokiniana]